MLSSHVIRPNARMTVGIRFPLLRNEFVFDRDVKYRYGASIELWRAMALDREVIVALEVRFWKSLYWNKLTAGVDEW
jgi:hypothetical protein